jgi:hypothetical protein
MDDIFDEDGEDEDQQENVTPSATIVEDAMDDNGNKKMAAVVYLLPPLPDAFIQLEALVVNITQSTATLNDNNA